MAQFTYSDYNSLKERAEAGSANSVNVGFFKLADDGDEALVRINVASLDDLHFASVHQLGASTKWMKVSCLNEVGSYGDNCEFCKAVASGNTSIGKAQKKVFIEMLVSYKDRLTNQWSAPVPVIWERPAGFSRELANKLRDFGPLKDVLLKITRNGKAGNMQTTYSLDYAVPAVFKPEMIPADFSAFEGNFKINRHSYWEKTAEEIHTFLTTGAFPEVKREAQADTTVKQVAPQSAYTTYQAPVQQTYQQQVYQAPQAAQVSATYITPLEQPVANSQQAANQTSTTKRNLTSNLNFF